MQESRVYVMELRVVGRGSTYAIKTSLIVPRHEILEDHGTEMGAESGRKTFHLSRNVTGYATSSGTQGSP